MTLIPENDFRLEKYVIYYKNTISLEHEQYPRPIANAYLAELQKDGEENKEKDSREQNDDETEEVVMEPDQEDERSQDDTPDVPIRFEEKKRLHWAGKACMSG